MSDVILAVGGTGQVLLHYYCQMFALGVVKTPFRAIVFDTDRYSRSLDTFERYFSALRQAGCPDPMPELRSASLEGTASAGARIHDVMEARDLPDSGYHHPLQAFYSRELLALQASEGLYSRPAASSLVVPNIPQLIRDADIGHDNSVLLIASTIGGTGAGLSLQLLCRVQELVNRLREVKLRAVLLGEYFVPDERKLSRAPVRFRSNKTWFLKSIEHAVPALLSYAWLDPDNERDKLPARDANAELDAPHLAWSAETQAFWQGLQAMLFLLNDRTAEARVHFTDREVSADQWSGYAPRPTVEQLLRAAIGRADALVKHDVVRRMGFEAMPASVWGEGLTNAVRQYGDVLKRGTGNAEDDPGRFCHAVQNELRRWWQTGQRDCFPIAGLFPQTAGKSPGIEGLRKVRWTPPAPGWSHEAFRNLESASRATAAALIDCAMRKGGAG